MRPSFLLPGDTLCYKKHDLLGNLIGWGEWINGRENTSYCHVAGVFDSSRLIRQNPGGPAFENPTFGSRKELLDTFDKGVAEARAALITADDSKFLAPWTLMAGGKALMTMPRVAVVRSFVMNHTIHHRAQLGVYLRLNDVPVPALYGPTADES